MAQQSSPDATFQECARILRGHQATEPSTLPARLLEMTGTAWHRPVYLTARPIVETEDGPAPSFRRKHRVECTCGWAEDRAWHASEHDAVLVWLRAHGQYQGWGPPVTRADFIGPWGADAKDEVF